MLRGRVFTMLGITVAVSFGWHGYRGLALRGYYAEAHLTLSYINVLQSGYYTQYQRFESFPAYGARLRGKDRCAQPDGARKIGFIIEGCEGKEGSVLPRYAYWAEADGDSDGVFEAVAGSGEDADDNSLVCLVPGSRDEWRAGIGTPLIHERHCW